MRSERRRQRADSLGSVLKSIASVAIFAVAVMLILGELGVNLAPLIASAGIAGVALGFGAQNLVKDFIAGLFMLLEDQYGVGDVVDVGEASGTVEAVGLRITTIRDARGVLWYIRNGEIVRVGNRSQGWALVIVDVPVGFAGVEEAAAVLRAAAAGLADDPEFADDLLEPPAGPRRRADHGRRRRRADDRQDGPRGAVAGRARAAPPAHRGAGVGRHHRADDRRPGLHPPAPAYRRAGRHDRPRRRRRHLRERSRGPVCADYARY